MSRTIRLRRLAGRVAALGLTASSAGCLGFLHPVNPPPAVLVQSCQEAPAFAREHVHVFLIGGLDPVDLANLRGVRDYVATLGFQNTHYGQFYDTDAFREEIVRIHQQDEAARFVVIGFSRGAWAGRGMVEALQQDGVHVDLLAYLDGKGLSYVPPDQLANVGRVLSVAGPGVVWTAPQLPGADNVVVSDAWHFAIPTHARALEALTRELALVGGGPAAADAAAVVEPAKPAVAQTAAAPEKKTGVGAVVAP